MKFGLFYFTDFIFFHRRVLFLKNLQNTLDRLLTNKTLSQQFPPKVYGLLALYNFYIVCVA